MERYIAIDNVCAWPNLTLMPNGTIVATIFNQPCHGRWQGDVECWASYNGGRVWSYLSTPAPHDPGTNRLNLAAGLAGNGDLIVIASGHKNRPTFEQFQEGDSTDFATSNFLEAWVCRSADGGKTWSINKSFPEAPESNMACVIPFGNVIARDNGSAYMSGYAARSGSEGEEYHSCYFYQSNDDGLTWGPGAIIDKGNHNETSPLHLGDGNWLAASRVGLSVGGVDLFQSADDGQTWERVSELSLPRQCPAHLLRLADKRILLTYGNRCRHMWGIDARISDDEGATWSAPVHPVDLIHGDSGYPSCVQTADGKIVTAYYSKKTKDHDRYYMGVQIWTIDEFFVI